MASLNVALRFALELCGVAAVAYWGWNATDSMPLRLLIAIVASLSLVTVWALIVAPGATNPVPQTARMLLGTGLLVLAAGALAIAGRRPQVL